MSLKLRLPPATAGSRALVKQRIPLTGSNTRERAGRIADRIYREWALAHPFRTTNTLRATVTPTRARAFELALAGMDRVTSPYLDGLFGALCLESFFPKECLDGSVYVTSYLMADLKHLKGTGTAEELIGLARDNSTRLYLALFNLRAVSIVRLMEEAAAAAPRGSHLTVSEPAAPPEAPPVSYLVGALWRGDLTPASIRVFVGECAEAEARAYAGSIAATDNPAIYRTSAVAPPVQIPLSLREKTP